MATVRAFKAIRPAREHAQQVVSLPYDVMNKEEATQMIKDGESRFLRISRAEIDFPDDVNPYSEEVYKKGKENLDSFIEDGSLICEKEPMLYIYRLVMAGRAQTGITACVPIDEYENGTIKKHELTLVEKEIDRIKHFDACDANTEPIFLTYREDKRINTLIEGYISTHEPEYDFTLDEGISHIVWCISDAKLVSAICELFKEVKSFYIADGHHRSASAYKVGVKRRKENPEYSGDEEFNFFMAVIFPDSDLKIYAYNRVVADLNGNTPAQFIQKIKDAGIEVEIQDKAFEPEEKHAFGMFLNERWYKLSIPEGEIKDESIDSLDVSILQDKILEPILGIADPRTDERIDFIGGIRGLSELERRVREDMKVAFAVCPVSVSDLIRVSDNDEIMPPKSTWFEPKLGSGLFIHAF